MSDTGSKPRKRPPLAAMNALNALGQHLMLQPSFLPGVPHIQERPSNRDILPLGAARVRWMRCGACGTPSPVVRCRCGRSFVLGADRYGSCTEGVSRAIAWAPIVVYPCCATCAGTDAGGSAVARERRCPACDGPLDISDERRPIPRSRRQRAS